MGKQFTAFTSDQHITDLNLFVSESFMGDKGPGNQNEGQTANQNRQANIIYSTEH